MNGTAAHMKVSDLWKVYGTGIHAVEAVRGVSFELARGEIVAIMGPSGCGKTSLLNCLSGIDSATKGSVLLEGMDPHRMKERERDAFRAEYTGFIFQFYNLVPMLSAAENVELPLLCRGVRPEIARARALDALTQVGLRERERHRPAELSSGQQQRVALARAIVNKPKVVFADEPTGALDSKTTEMVMDLIDHLNRTEGITFVIVTHNPDVAGYAHRTLFMDSGHLISERHSMRKGGISDRGRNSDG
ncbi:ABC transporter ATP-binding protein [Paenibacillus sedimenti]|uniref:ABC transporter ATP-binding protein n=1 Tax=Paenibacillus sedimenti TaxID=2770274 RepID=A0A926KTV0_9BACL|nr:ABC transporter ATP-binding protein [Paenibacillus sedimenti]MBD0382133.1 ABC transporter ATP-binding protein [Paenibacillus sedimenti]